MAKKNSKKPTPSPSRIGSQAQNLFEKPVERRDVFTQQHSAPVEHPLPEPEPVAEHSQKGPGRPKKFDDNKMKTTVSFQREQIVWLDTVCTQILSNTGKIIDRGDIIRECLSALQESGLDLTQAKSSEEIQKIISQRLAN